MGASPANTDADLGELVRSERQRSTRFRHMEDAKE
jgi:hypothetical protein